MDGLTAGWKKRLRVLPGALPTSEEVGLRGSPQAPPGGPHPRVAPLTGSSCSHRLGLGARVTPSSDMPAATESPWRGREEVRGTPYARPPHLAVGLSRGASCLSRSGSFCEVWGSSPRSEHGGGDGREAS